MKKLNLILLLFLSLSIFAQNVNSKVDEIINREMKERRIPGLQLAVVQNGKIVLSKSYGYANIQDNIPVKNTTIFPINSNTKIFTGVSVMQLVEQGKIELHTPIKKYLNDLPSEWQNITVDQLLTHISGLPEILQLLDPLTGNIGPLKTEQAIWEKLKTLPLEFKTGEQFSYNQTNYYLLGKIIEKVSNQSFPDNFEKKQFEVVGMKHTLFGDSRDLIPNFAPTYRYRNFFDGKKTDDKLVNNYTEFPDFTRTGAGINSTAEDMANWIIALQNGKLFQKSATLDLMWSPSKFNNGNPTNWTRGWGIAKFRKNHKAIGMSGGNRSALLIYPDDKLAIIVLTNLGGSAPEDFLEEIAGCYNADILEADPLTFLRKNLREIGFDKAIDFTEKTKKKNPAFDPQEVELNNWAYRMMANNQQTEASEIFKLNVHLFPNSWNAYDSYGEVLLKTGNKNKAVEMYKKSVELNPKNENGKQMLLKIKKEIGK
ncbi:serine hydrolase [Epilithonimonas ginsengisoli]|uniref:Serine hydrolase n=1 Tax=Epilithonimonas ginsengisoli TaxID=1245592 RepID=A0ABU4JE86_9FLAO|nr:MULTISPECIES: serine hydrolase domain-containing protein [Chryseobacterium group]MBV6878998.1 serine hydrolase [Epilithonimonas sp. FP105]MDW8547846.1 serine hydrolase [Epilithonimonas ginsengisoli]OAH74911.1 serine hydrolase [Chryseobacterium sp. FP211-J200]